MMVCCCSAYSFFIAIVVCSDYLLLASSSVSELNGPVSSWEYDCTTESEQTGTEQNLPERHMPLKDRGYNT